MNWKKTENRNADNPKYMRNVTSSLKITAQKQQKILKVLQKKTFNFVWYRK